MKHIRGDFNQSFVNHTIDEMIYEFMEDNEIDGLSMAIVQAPYIPRAVGYGLADIKNENEKLVSINTVFGLGEISLAYLDVALMQAHEQKLLTIQDPIGKWIPNLKEEYKAYTLLDLMLHKTKITDFRKHPNYDKTKKYSEEEIIKFINDLQANETKEIFYLSASNAYLLATAIEKATKMSYEDFVKKYQIDFLNLKNTFFYDELEKILVDENLAKTNRHVLFKQQKEYINPTEVAIAYIDNDPEKPDLSFDKNLKGYGDVYASATDVSFWDIALAGTVLIKDKALSKLIYEGTKVGDQLVHASGGWEQTNSKGFLDIFGTNGGYTAYLSRFTAPEDLICVTLLINKPNVDLTELARNIAAAYKTDLALEYDFHDLYQVESTKDAKTTYDDLINLLKENQVHIFTEIDHTEGAKKANLELPFNKVVVFGNPKVGTHLMMDEPAIGLELPLKIQVFEDKEGRVWLATQNLEAYYEKYNEQDFMRLVTINDKIKSLVNQAARIYHK